MDKEEKNSEMILHGPINSTDNLLRFVVDGIVLPIDLYWIQNVKPYSGEVSKGVIILAPVYNSTRLFKVWSMVIERLNPRPEKVIFCENNSTDSTLKMINEWNYPHEIIRVWFKSDATKGQELTPIAHVRDLLLTRARTYGAKMAIFFDDDCIPERQDVIQCFLDDNLDIVGGEYIRPFPEGLFMATKWDPTDVLPNELPTMPANFWSDFGKSGKYYMLISPDAMENKLYKATMTSAGALALSYKLIQDKRMSFYPVRQDLSKDSQASEDFGFCLLAGRNGYRVWLDMRIKFSHMIQQQKKRPWVVEKDDSYIPFSY